MNKLLLKSIVSLFIISFSFFVNAADDKKNEIEEQLFPIKNLQTQNESLAFDENSYLRPSYLDLAISPVKKPALKVWLYSAPVLIGLRLHREDTVNHNQAELAKNNSLRNNSKYGDYAGRLYTNIAYTGAFAAAGYFSNPVLKAR